jgi:hypothetical protein
MDIVQYRRATASRHRHCSTQKPADHWLWVSVIPYHTIFDLFLFVLLLQYILVRCLLRPTPTLYFLRSQNTSCDLDRLLYRSPYYFYASPITFGRSSASVRVVTRKRRTPPGRFYIDVRASVPPLRGNLLGVKRFSTFFIFLSLLSDFFAGWSIVASQLLYRLSLPLYTLCDVSSSSISRSYCSVTINRKLVTIAITAVLVSSEQHCCPFWYRWPSSSPGRSIVKGGYSSAVRHAQGSNASIYERATVRHPWTRHTTECWRTYTLLVCHQTP